MATDQNLVTPFHDRHPYSQLRHSIISKEDAVLGSLATPNVLLSSSKNHLSNLVPPPRHSRSRSAPENTFDVLNKDITPMTSEPLQVPGMKKRLKIDKSICHTLEKEERQLTTLLVCGHHRVTPEAKQLVEEISSLEEEIADLEQYVLTLYRGLFNKCTPRSSSIYSSKLKSGHLNRYREKGPKAKSSQQDHAPKQSLQRFPSQDDLCTSATIESSSASTIQPKTRHAPMLCESTDVARDCQVPIAQSPQPMKVLKLQTVKSILSLNDDSPRPLKDYLSEPPNQLSEDLIRCMASIYCKLSVSAPISSGVPESPVSCTSSSTSLSSIHGMFSDGWSPGSRTECSFEAPLIDPFQVKGKLGRTAAYSSMVEIPHISTDKDRLNDASRMLRKFRSMVEKLEKVDPSHLMHDEKVAFWINIYNALLMHAYLAYGIPRSSLKRMSLLQKASYKVGGHSVSAHTIEHYILRLRSHRPTQWLQNLFSSASKLKSGDGRRALAIDRPEPLVCFALCCGGRSDPAVRVFTAKNVHEELKASMQAFLQASIGFQNNRKVLLPKILEWYTREVSLSSGSLLDWVVQYMNDKDRESIQKCINSKPQKAAGHCIEWLPYNFSFRYILHRNLTTVLPPYIP